MLSIIIIVSVFIYCAMIGIVWPILKNIIIFNCLKCSIDRCYRDHGSIFFLGSVFWPITIPVFLGMSLGNSQGRLKRKQDQEIEAAEHMARLAEINARETRALEEALRR